MHRGGKSHWNVIPMGIGIAIWLIRGMGIKQRKRFINVYKLPLNPTVPARQFNSSTSDGDFKHPTLGHKTELQWGDPEFQ